jgi:predicted transcriptional regulator
LDTKNTNNGGPVRKEVCSIRLPKELLRAVEKIAVEEDRPRGAVLRRIVAQWFEQKRAGVDMGDGKNE